MVGTRRPTGYGIAAARHLAAGVAAEGGIVISGLADGIDAAAHSGALDAGGVQIAVLGHGLDHQYPAAHHRLRVAIATRGAVCTEWPDPVPPAPFRFLRRNRLIAALADAVVVVEADARSGALGTARLAVALGRPLLAVPGGIFTPQSRGTNHLLRGGATLALSAADCLRAAGATTSGPTRSAGALGTAPGAFPDALPLDGDARRLRRVLADAALPVGQLAAAAGLPVARALAAATQLELFGLARAEAGGFRLGSPEGTVPIESAAAERAVVRIASRSAPPSPVRPERPDPATDPSPW